MLPVLTASRTYPVMRQSTLLVLFSTVHPTPPSHSARPLSSTAAALHNASQMPATTPATCC